jgi:RNA 3'-terminal phosphate cyclase (ATP)
MITIDGSTGEGGGQILRSALALSMTTGKPFRIERIRAGRSKPGLMRQHLTCVLAAAEVCGARTHGAFVGSQELTFSPGTVQSGNYQFAVGTAGGTTLVLQALLPALLRAGGDSTVTIDGGTHAKGAPPVEFVQKTLAPVLARCGVDVRVELVRHGFYPAGGGRIVVHVPKFTRAVPLSLLERGEARAMSATSIFSRLSYTIAQRELAVCQAKLAIKDEHLLPQEITTSPGPGNTLLITLPFEHITEVCSCAGEVDKSSEQVAHQAVSQAQQYIASGAPVSEHLADQLMLPLAMLAGGTYRTCELSTHSTTNMQVLKEFGVQVAFEAATSCITVQAMG